MSLLKIGTRALEMRVAESAPRTLRHFVARLTRTNHMRTLATQVMHVRGGQQTRLTVTPHSGEVLLELAVNASGDQTTLEIGTLQAAARSVAAMSGGELALLHGSAVTMDGGRSAIGVLDGGRGQGKTSLALGIAARGGSLIVDEFAFTIFRSGQPCILPMPTLPWHVRADMTPLLVPRAAARLLYPEDLPAAALSGSQPVPLSLIVIPDHSLRPGELREPVGPAGRRLLRAAVTDHEAKLRDPRLDHVSIFSSPDDVSVGDSLDGSSRYEETLDLLAAVPIICLGVGMPHDLPASVTSAIHRIARAG
ncbi:hypothetical protein [Verrucosispora sp. NA02020]|uniref:hypothetical protein n=1 Tax=Verrucosispora sp. NA02020 TaxID=2742132 RepID=UPI003D70BC14